MIKKGGYIGSQCLTVYVNPCVSSPCINGGTCVTVASNQYICTCPINYSGLNCATYNPCASLSCQNGGNCVVLNNQASCSCNIKLYIFSYT